jgi:putative ABC transport system substrate-binding protein
MSYAPSLPDQFRKVAVYVDKILKGVKPAELPVEQPTKFEFSINLKTAKQIGLTIPPNVLARADKVIQVKLSHRIIQFGLAAMLLSFSFPVEAQQSKKIPRIGLLWAGSSSAASPRNEAFRKGLRELGYKETHSVAIEYRHAEGKLERLPNLAAELVRSKVDAIVTGGTPQLLAAKDATRTIPIVMAFAGDPVGQGFVASLARPGGNITGLSAVAPELSGKRLELLKETVPYLSRAAVLWNPADPGIKINFDATVAAARGLGINIQSVEVRSPNEFDGALKAIIAARAQGLNVLQANLINAHRTQIVKFAAQNRLPTMFGEEGLMDAGGLMSYGPDYRDLFRRAAVYVDKILKGAKPSDLPVEQPTKFELVINLKTAKQIGLTTPPNILARADRVIK